MRLRVVRFMLRQLMKDRSQYAETDAATRNADQTLRSMRFTTDSIIDGSVLAQRSVTFLKSSACGRPRICLPLQNHRH